MGLFSRKKKEGMFGFKKKVTKSPQKPEGKMKSPPPKSPSTKILTAEGFRRKALRAKQ